MLKKLSILFLLAAPAITTITAPPTVPLKPIRTLTVYEPTTKKTYTVQYFPNLSRVGDIIDQIAKQKKENPKFLKLHISGEQVSGDQLLDANSIHLHTMQVFDWPSKKLPKTNTHKQKLEALKMKHAQPLR